MIETKEKTIDGSKYSVTQMTARKALKTKAQLLKIFGAAFAEIFIQEKPSKNLKGLTFSKKDAVNAIQSLATQLEDEKFEFLVLELLQNVRKNGIELTKEIIDFEFAGKLNTLFKVIWFVIEVNFENFFSELGITGLFSNKENKTD